VKSVPQGTTHTRMDLDGVRVINIIRGAGVPLQNFTMSKLGSFWKAQFHSMYMYGQYERAGGIDNITMRDSKEYKSR